MFTVTRSARNPILAPAHRRAWEAVASFNPSAVVHDGVTHLFYRASARPDLLLAPGATLSSIGHAIVSGDIAGERTQVIAPGEAWDEFGCEDPRATYFEGKWYIFYTALGGFPFGPSNIKLAVAVGESPDRFPEKHLVTPFNAKAAVLFPSRIQGDVALLLTCHTDFTPEHPRPTIALARAKNIEDFWNPEYWNEWHEHLAEHALPDVRRHDSEHMEVGAVPIETPQGWLFIYSHIENYYDEHNRVFGVEALLLDRDEPTKIIGRTPSSFMVAEDSYEKYGMVPNVVFPSGAVIENETLRIFYGAADTTLAVANVSVSDLMDSLDALKREHLVERNPHNPILEPILSHAWESKCVFNAAALRIDGVTHLLYRAMGANNTSVLGYAKVENGIVTERSPEPVYSPRETFEMKQGKPDGNSGCEDPRLTRIGDTIYLTYTAYDGVHDTRAALSSISLDDFLAQRWGNWALPKLLTPGNVNEKDTILFPEKVGGRYMIIHRIDPNICADTFETLDFSRPLNRCLELMTPRPGMWDSEKIGAAAPPLRLPEGWLFIYHAVGADHGYRLGAALLDAETASNVIARTALPIMEPITGWEKDGEIGNVVFSCGMTLDGDVLSIYYGGADRALGVATTSLAGLVKMLLPNKK